MPAAVVVRRPVARAPSRAASIITRYRTRTIALARRGGRAVAKRSWERRALIVAPITGFAMAKLADMELPTVPGLGKNGTIAVVSTVAAVAMPGNQWLGHVAAAALAVAAHELTRTGTLAGDDDDGGIP